MIVTIHPRVANRYPTVDLSLPIQVHNMSEIGWSTTVKVKGNQLLLAGIHTLKSAGVAIEAARWYYMHRNDFELVRYVRFTPETADLCREKVNPDYPMRWWGTAPDGMILVRPEDVVDAGVNWIHVHHRYKQPDGFVHIKPSCIRF